MNKVVLVGSSHSKALVSTLKDVAEASTPDAVQHVMLAVQGMNNAREIVEALGGMVDVLKQEDLAEVETREQRIRFNEANEELLKANSNAVELLHSQEDLKSRIAVINTESSTLDGELKEKRETLQTTEKEMQEAEKDVMDKEAMCTTVKGKPTKAKGKMLP